MSKNVRNILITILITTIVCCAAFILTIGFRFGFGSFVPSRETVSIEAKLSEIKKLIDKEAIMPFDEETALSNAVYFYVATLEDRYCTYFEADEYETFISEMEGSFAGIGINVTTKTAVLEDGLFVYRVIGNSPAEAAGVKNGDIIVEAEGVSFENYPYEDAVDILLGEVGTSVNITVERNGELLDFTIPRQDFTKRVVEYDMIGNIGYIIIYEFDSVAQSQFRDALNALEESGVSGYVFDVRNNPGGELNAVKNMVDMLVPKDELVVLQYKDSESVIYSSNSRIVENKPMAVLLNGESASAAELFSSALRDILSVPLIGEQSFGKGVGQTSRMLSDGSALKYTTFRYMTKSRTNYDGIGLEPDYIVASGENWDMDFYTITREEDVQLKKALQLVNEQLEQ